LGSNPTGRTVSAFPHSRREGVNRNYQCLVWKEREGGGGKAKGGEGTVGHTKTTLYKRRRNKAWFMELPIRFLPFWHFDSSSLE